MGGEGNGTAKKGFNARRTTYFFGSEDNNKKITLFLLHRKMPFGTQGGWLVESTELIF